MIFRVCGASLNLNDDTVKSFLESDTYYNGSDRDSSNTFEDAKRQLLADGYQILYEDEKIVLFGVKYNKQFKIFMFELLRKTKEEGKALSYHENSRILKDFKTLTLKE